MVPQVVATETSCDTELWGFQITYLKGLFFWLNWTILEANLINLLSLIHQNVHYLYKNFMDGIKPETQVLDGLWYQQLRW